MACRFSDHRNRWSEKIIRPGCTAREAPDENSRTGAMVKLGMVLAEYARGQSTSEKLTSAIKKLDASTKRSAEYPGIKWNAANHAGVTFHTLTVPVPQTEKPWRQMFGDHFLVGRND